MYKVPVLSFKLLVLSWITARRQIIHDRTASRITWYKNYDFIVVGAGTAGCAVAHRLTENPSVKLLLLESGGAQNAIWTDIPGLEYNISSRFPQVQFQYWSEPQINAAKQYPGSRPIEPVGNVIGGTSAHNTMIFNRGNRRDYDAWAFKYGADGWSFEEVLPFFRKYENNTDLKLVNKNPKYHGTNGPVQISSVKEPPILLNIIQSIYNELGYETTDANGPRQLGTRIMQQFIDSRGLRSSSANAYIDPNPHPNNLHILARAQVVKILFNGLTAVGVEFLKNEKRYRVYAQKEVILTAGTINTPKLLMLSGIGINSHLQQFGIPVLLDLPVGNNYQNHPQINVESRINNPAYFYGPPLLSVQQLSQLYFERRGRLSESPFLSLYYNTRYNTPTDWPNQLLSTSMMNDILVMHLNFARFRSRGTIRLQSTSPYIQPRIDPAFLADPIDFAVAVEATSFMFYVLERTSLAPLVRPPSFETYGCPSCPGKPRYQCTEGIKCYILFNSQTTYHPCCSCRMGAVNREDVVVDPHLRVKNAKNLRICDASVFPLLPNSNTNAPTHMVAEKCAQLIKDIYKLG